MSDPIFGYAREIKKINGSSAHLRRVSCVSDPLGLLKALEVDTQVRRMRRNYVKALKIFCSVLLFSGLCSTGSLADDSGSYEISLQRFSENPDDPQIAFNFAKMAIRNGDYRLAIAALESILKNNPELSNIRLELGILYKQVGALELAEGYIRQALEDPNVPANVRNRAKSILASTVAEISPHLFSGNLYLAGTYDDNANAGPSDRSIVINGLENILSEDAVATDDHSVELVGGLQYSYQFESQSDNSFDVDFLFFNREYGELSELDTNLLELVMGPRYRLGPLVSPTLSIKPYFLISSLQLDKEKYRDSVAIGLNVRKPVRFKTFVEIDTKFEDQEFSNSDERPSAETRTGSFIEVRGKLLHQVSGRVRLTGKLGVSSRVSDEDYESFQDIVVGVAVRYVYSSANESRRPWYATLALDYRDIEYDEADRVAGFAEPREEQRSSFRFNNNIPFADSVSFIASISYTDNESGIELYDFTNWGVTLGLSYGF